MGVETKKEYPFSVDTWTDISKRKPFHFLTHAHKDHTVGIDTHGTFPIYCSSLTEKLVLRRYPRLQSSLFKSLEIGEPKFIAHEDQGFAVTAFDANHCPGAIMMLFEGPFGNVLHTGDCRLTIECLNQLPRHYVSGKGRALDCVYLDCTFGKESMVMLSKENAIEQVTRCIWNHPSEARVYLACDMLGQETLLEAVSRGFGVKIFVDKDRLPNYHADLEVVAPDFLTDDKECTRFEICEGFPNFYERAMHTIKQARKEGKILPLFIRPSAQWYTFEERLEGDGSGVIGATSSSSRFGGAKRQSKTSSSTEATRDEFGVWHICYSMHSSRGELERALKLLNPVEVISTTPHCLIYDIIKTSRPTQPTPSIVSDEVTVVEAIENHCVLEDRELKRGRRDYSCSPSKAVNNSVVDSPTRLIPLFGSAQFSLPPSPPAFPSSSPCVRVSPTPTPPTVELAPSPPFRSDSLVASSEVFSQGLTSSQSARCKRLFVETSSAATKSISQTPSKKYCNPDPVPSHEDEPCIGLPSPSLAICPPAPYIRSASMPSMPSVPHVDSLSEDVRSKSLSRIPSRRKYRIPTPMPSLLDMKKNEG